MLVGIRLAVSSVMLAGLVTSFGPAVPAVGETVAAGHAAGTRTAAGARLWVASYRVPGKHPSSRAAAVAASPDGSMVFVTGSSANNAFMRPRGVDYDLATVAYDAATGKPVWVARYRGPLGGGNFAAAIAVSPNGSTVFVTGQNQEAGGGPSAYVTVAYDAATGTELWAQSFQTSTPAGGGPDAAAAIAVSPDGSAVFVTGNDVIPSVPGEYSYGTVAYDAATGAQLWTATFAGAGMGAAARAVAVSPDGSQVFVTGTVTVNEAPVTQNFATVAYSAATGAQVWMREYQGIPGSTTTGAQAIAVSPHGSAVFVTGGTDSGTGGDYATVSYNGITGKTQWARIYGHPGSAGVTTGTAAVVNPAGTSVIVTGANAAASGSGAYATVAYSTATGNRLWVRRDTSQGFLSYPAAAMNPGGTAIYVTYTFGGGYYAVEAIDVATGARLWRRIYTGLVEGTPDSIAVSAAPAVFVTGSSLYHARDQYATVAYSG